MSTPETEAELQAKIDAMLSRILAQPITHNVVVTYRDGTSRSLGVRGEKAAENNARGERRHIGRPLIDRETGRTVHVVSVEVVPIRL